MLPVGADAVVMVEYTSTLDATTIEVTKPVAPGENVLRAGDDLAAGETIFKIGWQLRPQDIGMLAALGITELSVFRRPKVAVISTGDEIVPVGTRSIRRQGSRHKYFFPGCTNRVRRRGNRSACDGSR